MLKVGQGTGEKSGFTDHDIEHMTLDEKLRYAYQFAAQGKRKEEARTEIKDFRGVPRPPQQIVRPNHSSTPWYSQFHWGDFKLTVRNDFEGGNLRWCELTEFSQERKRVCLNIWLTSDQEYKE